MWSRIYLIPLLQAEADRDLVRRTLASRAMEKELLGAETKVYNSDRYAYCEAVDGLGADSTTTDWYDQHTPALLLMSPNKRIEPCDGDTEHVHTNHCSADFSVRTTMAVCIDPRHPHKAVVPLQEQAVYLPLARSRAATSSKNKSSANRSRPNQIDDETVQGHILPRAPTAMYGLSICAQPVKT